MRLEAHQPEGHGVVAALDQILQQQRSAGGLRKLADALDQEVVMHPDRCAGMTRAAVGLVLGDLVGMVDLAMIYSPGVDVETLAEVLDAHNRAFEVPPRCTTAPGAVPHHLPCLTWWRQTPNGEVGGMALAWDLFDPRLSRA